MTGPCVDRHSAPLRIGDRVSVDCTITAIDEDVCFIQARIRANDGREVAVKIAHFNAFADQVVKLPDTEGRIDRWG